MRETVFIEWFRSFLSLILYTLALAEFRQGTE
jgi:hypothetical protein